VPHYENCGTCCGFGINYIGEDGEHIPIIAAEVLDKTYPNNWISCPECGSTPKGIPISEMRKRFFLNLLFNFRKLKRRIKDGSV